MLTLRIEAEADRAAVSTVNLAAFAQGEEADLVRRLTVEVSERLSLVAIEDDELVGHILFTPVTLEDAGPPLKGMGLAPLAVLPQSQGRGIGTALVNEGLQRLRHAGYHFVVVLGHPGYYPRFGFEPASRYGMRCQWEGVPDDAFMLLPLEPASLTGRAGLVRFHPAFDQQV
ncbi:MAG: N-acetyltransferase [Chromatiales bacterium]|jgi:putative acetyltransferase